MLKCVLYSGCVAKRLAQTWWKLYVREELSFCEVLKTPWHWLQPSMICFFICFKRAFFSGNLDKGSAGVETYPSGDPACEVNLGLECWGKPCCGFFSWRFSKLSSMLCKQTNQPSVSCCSESRTKTPGKVIYILKCDCVLWKPCSSALHNNNHQNWCNEGNGTLYNEGWGGGWGWESACGQRLVPWRLSWTTVVQASNSFASLSEETDSSGSKSCATWINQQFTCKSGRCQTRELRWERPVPQSNSCGLSSR